MRNSPAAPADQPHPAAWERHAVLRDGARVFIRPMRPDDASLFPEFFAHVSRDDIRLRFFAPMRELSPEMIDKLTRFDHARAMAFIALDETDGRMLGAVRLHYDPDSKGGEYAILVRSVLKGHGLGWELMQRIIEYATAQGLERIHGQVLGENHTMLQMCAELGFHIVEDHEAPGIKRVTLDLPQPRARRPN